MTTATTRGQRIPARTLKSPLAAPGHAAQADIATAASALAASVRSPLTDRESTLAEVEGYLRTVNNRDGRPYEEKTISVYSAPAKNLDGWLTANGIEGDSTITGTPLLNRYFRVYYLEHGQGGTHTLQRNLIQLFNFPERDRGFASPYTDGPRSRDHPHPAQRGHPPSRAARRDEHPPGGRDQDPGVPARPVERGAGHRRGTPGGACPNQRPCARDLPACPPRPLAR
jgi:hypothetical protein